MSVRLERDFERKEFWVDAATTIEEELKQSDLDDWTVTIRPMTSEDTTRVGTEVREEEDWYFEACKDEKELVMAFGLGEDRRPDTAEELARHTVEIIDQIDEG